jgi:hypothetical protein
MIGRKMLGLIMVIIGVVLVVSGTIMFLMEPPEPSQDAFCGLCMIKYPIYCYKTLHGALFDTGWLLIIIGGVTILVYRKEALRQINRSRARA